MPCAAGIEARHDSMEIKSALIVGENVAAQAETGVVVIAFTIRMPEVDQCAGYRAARACEHVARKIDRLPLDAALSQIAPLRRSGLEERSLSLG